MRTGKIARLPYDIRTQINERLRDGEEGAPLLDWLNSQPEVLAVLKESFNDVPISKQNLGEWRRGGYREWLAQKDLVDAAASMADCTEEIEEDFPGHLLADGLAVVITAHFARLLQGWDGEVDDKFEAKARVFRLLCHDIVKLQRANHQVVKQKRELEEDKRADVDRRIQEAKRKAMAPLRAMREQPVYAQLYGGGPLGEALADISVNISHDLPYDLPDLDKLLAAQHKYESRRGKKGRRTKTVAAAKREADATLTEENDHESNPVKPSQTTLTENDP